MLARHVAASLDVHFRRDLVRRVRKTRQQTSLDAAARRENVRGAFQVQEALEGAAVLLVDDVYTTGATMAEAADALKRSGADEVTGLVFARAYFS
jgi:predicted amidophosphoribosyltransferase